MGRCSLAGMGKHTLASRNRDVGEMAWMDVRASLVVLAELGGREQVAAAEGTILA